MITNVKLEALGFTFDQETRQWSKLNFHIQKDKDGWKYTYPKTGQPIQIFEMTDLFATFKAMTGKNLNFVC